MNEYQSSLRIGFVGDIGLGPAHDKQYIQYNSGHFLHEEVKSLFNSVDLVIGNLECSIPPDDNTKKTPSELYTTPHVLRCFKEIGNFHLCLANNHIADYGDKGVESTLNYLNKYKIPYFGAGLNYADAIKPHVISVCDLSIGFICASEFHYSNASKKAAGSAPLKKKRLIRQIRDLKEHCQHIIVILHADEEFKDYPAPYRVRLSRKLIDAGADAVIQHHPHVVQGVEIYKGSTIAYSLGNWIFKIGEYQLAHKQTRYGVFFTLDLPRDKNGRQKHSYTHTIIDGRHRPVPLVENQLKIQQKRLSTLSNQTMLPIILKDNWRETCRESLIKEVMNCYYTFRRSGARRCFDRVEHILKEPLFRRQLLGWITFGYW